MDIAQMGIDALHGFTVENRLQAQHTVSRRMLRADVDHIVIIAEKRILLLAQIAILVKPEFQAIVRLHVVFKRVLVVGLEILAEGIALEITTQEQATHIRMSQELDAEEVEHLTLQQVGTLPKTDHRGNDMAVANLTCQHLHTGALMADGIL